jgi:hypothetical protein
MIRIWTAQRSPRTRPRFRRFAQSEDTDQEDYFMMMIRRMIRVNTTIGNWMT